MSVIRRLHVAEVLYKGGSMSFSERYNQLITPVRPDVVMAELIAVQEAVQRQFFAAHPGKTAKDILNVVSLGWYNMSDTDSEKDFKGPMYQEETSDEG